MSRPKPPEPLKTRSIRLPDSEWSVLKRIGSKKHRAWILRQEKLPKEPKP